MQRAFRERSEAAQKRSEDTQRTLRGAQRSSEGAQRSLKGGRDHAPAGQPASLPERSRREVERRCPGGAPPPPPAAAAARRRRRQFYIYGGGPFVCVERNHMKGNPTAIFFCSPGSNLHTYKAAPFFKSREILLHTHFPSVRLLLLLLLAS